MKISLLERVKRELDRRWTRAFRQLARNRYSRLAQFLNQWAVGFHHHFENWNYKASANGELRVLKCLGEIGEMKVVIDAGANRGGWSKYAVDHLPNAKVHAFELSPIVAAALRAEVGNEPRITVNECGLSDEGKEIEFFYAPDRELLSSGVVVTGSAQVEKARGMVMRGDAYCRAHGIERVDFLKIDVEGMEDRVMRGFSEMLEGGAVRVIQFEYGWVHIESHFLLIDFYALLTKHGYVVGKIYPQEVLFKDYHYSDENFLGPNYLAVLRTETALLSRLARVDLQA